MINFNLILSSKSLAPLPPSDSTSLGYSIPITVLVLVLIGFIYYIHLIRKGHLALSETFIWILFTLLMITISLYLLILQIMYTFGGHQGFNLFDYLAQLIGINANAGWFTLIIVILISFLYTKLFYTTIKIAKLKSTINALAKEVAIMNGKLSHTLDHQKNKKDKSKKNDK